MPPGDIAPVFLTTALALIAGVTFILRGPVGKALARRLEGNQPPLNESAEIAGRLAQVDELSHRVAELEERLDFAERLLAKSREPHQLP
jgi:ubiquinone biosynthesis protein UbiJ